MLLESLVLTAEVFDHILQFLLTELSIVQHKSQLLLQLGQCPCQRVSFLSKYSVAQKRTSLKRPVNFRDFC